MFRQKDTLNMHVCSKNTSQNISMYVQLARYLGYACIQQKYLTKHIYVQVARYLDTHVYGKIPHKIYVCLGSKIPKKKKREQKESEQEKNKKKNNKLLSS